MEFDILFIAPIESVTNHSKQYDIIAPVSVLKFC